MVLSSTSDSVLNFRKLRHDFSQACLKEGKALFEKGAVTSANLTGWNEENITLEAEVKGQFNEAHACHIEILRLESDIAYSSCDCTHGVDCQHFACLLFYLEQHFPDLLVAYLKAQDEKKSGKNCSQSSKKCKDKVLSAEVGRKELSNGVEKRSRKDSSHQDEKKSQIDANIIEKKGGVRHKESKDDVVNMIEPDEPLPDVPLHIRQADLLMREAERKSREKVRERQEKQYVEEYFQAGLWLSKSSLVARPLGEMAQAEQAELFLAIGPLSSIQSKNLIEIHFAVKVVGKPKPVLIQQPKLFLHSLFMQEPLILGSQRTLLTDNSFGDGVAQAIALLRDRQEVIEKQDKDGKTIKSYALPYDAFIQLVSSILVMKESNVPCRVFLIQDSLDTMYELLVDQPLKPRFDVNLMKDPHKSLHIEVSFPHGDGCKKLREVKLFHAKRPFIAFENKFILLSETVGVKQSLELEAVGSLSIPHPLFSTFITYSLPNLEQYGLVHLSSEAKAELNKMKCHSEKPMPVVNLNVNDHDELSLEMSFKYGRGQIVPEIQRINSDELMKQNICDAFSKPEKTPAQLARNFAQEKLISQNLTWGMLYDEKKGVYTTKAERKIQDFFVEVVAPNFKAMEWEFDSYVKDVYSYEEIELSLHLSLDAIKEIGNGRASQCSIHMTSSGCLANIPLEKIVEAYKAKRPIIDTGKPLQYAEERFGLSTKQYIVGMEALHDLMELVYDLSIPSFHDGEKWSVPLWMIFGLDSLSYPNVKLNIVKDKSLQALIEKLSNVDVSKEGCDKEKKGQSKGIDQEEKENRSSNKKKYELRPYQRDGVRWMGRLRDYGLAGVLADDMGLGKTLQTIVTLSQFYFPEGNSNKKGDAKDPTLIICPTSLVENWREEILKFEPRLKTLLFFGSPQERKKLVQEIPSAHVIVTSYGILQKEVELFESIPLGYVILDEAQTIKNRETRNARSVKKLQSQYRLVLTGTPVENSLEDLWSLFDFLMPGFLGTFERFSANYIRPLSKDPDKILQKLKNKIQPFVLRRMKQDVLDDLPPISHEIFYSTLKEEERALYEEYAKKAKAELQELVEKDGFDKARLHVLATISKLKQICCHPHLVLSQRRAIEKAEAGSDDQEGEQFETTEVELFDSSLGSKYELLMEILESLVSNGRKTVVFSQYTKMLQIIRADLENKGIKYLYLDGSTKNRLQLVKQFNEDEGTHVFLISLKAGGTGLNLVGADTVIHYDLWWNPAVENQATDRVWRMGQKTKVSSYKIIVKGTIEEKIAQLHEKKKDLGDIIQSDEETLSSLTYEDVMALLHEI